MDVINLNPHFDTFVCRAYDRAAIRFNGRDTVTNFDPSSYDGDVPPETEKDGIILVFLCCI